MLINNVPKPIPAIQLYVGCQYSLPIINPNISMVLTVGLPEVINKYKLYSYGIDDWVIKGSTRYLYQYENEIKNVKTGKEMMEKFHQLIPDLDVDKNTKSMVNKWCSTFDTIFKEKFTTNTYSAYAPITIDGKQYGVPVTDELEVRYPDGHIERGHPFIMLMEACAVPVINNSMAQGQKWFRNMLADILYKLYVHQMQMGEKKHRMWFVTDELNAIYEKGMYDDYASRNFEKMFRQGAINSLGFIGNTQSLTKLNPEMYNNATHICCVYMRNPKDRKLVRDTFGLPKVSRTNFLSLGFLI
jgi:hypothetical protein